MLDPKLKSVFYAWLVGVHVHVHVHTCSLVPRLSHVFQHCTLILSDMIDLESKFEVLEAEVKEINANKETLKRNLLDLIELQHILQKTQTFFMEVATCTCVFMCEREGGGEGEREFFVCANLWGL